MIVFSLDMVDNQTHISLLGTGELSLSVKEFQDEIGYNGLTVKRRHRDEWPVYAGLEAYLPTLVLLVIGSAYFRSFLQQAGKDHAVILTRALERLSKKLFHREKDAAIVGRDKTNKPDYSFLFSVWASVNKCTVKFIFKTRCSEEEYAATGIAAIEFLNEYHTGGNLAKYRAIIDATEDHTQIVVAYDYDSDSLYLL